MGLEENTGGTTYLNIKKGRIAYKDKITKEKKDSGAISGFITGCKFEIKNYEGRDYEQCNLTIIDGDQHFTLQMRTDSGYFRCFCNSLKNGDSTKRVKIVPMYEEDGAKKKSWMYVHQNGDEKGLQWYSTKADPKDVPALDKVMFKGKEEWDGTKQLEYWKNWCNTTKWADAFESSSLTRLPETKTEKKSADETNQFKDIGNPLADIDTEDLPF